MSISWYVDFLQRVREFRTHCADAMSESDHSRVEKLNVRPISRAVDALERHWKKQFPLHRLPHREDIDRHLHVGLGTDVLNLMTKDIHDAEVKALSVLGETGLSEGHPFVAPERIEELQSVARKSAYDLSRVVRLCEELNIVSKRQCHIATAVLVRALIDHIPPVFDMSNFNQVANNYAGSKSCKDTARQLDESSRKIADGLLHSPVRRMESLPTATQVDFRQSLDVLLGEVARLLKKQQSQGTISE